MLLSEEGIEEADVYFPEKLLSESQFEQLALRLNQNTGEWDFDLLANGFEIDSLLDIGFDAKDLGLLEDAPPKAPKPEKFVITATFDNRMDAVQAFDEIDSTIAKWNGLIKMK